MRAAYVEDLAALDRLGEELGELLAERAVAALGIPGQPVESFGKAAAVGADGELEHAAAILHPKLGAPFRDVLGKGAALIPSSKKRGGLGAPLDIPLGHKDAAYVRSHFDGMEVRIGDAPRADEIVVAIAVTDSGRPHPRVGGLPKDEIKGEDGAALSSLRLSRDTTSGHASLPAACCASGRVRTTPSMTIMPMPGRSPSCDAVEQRRRRRNAVAVDEDEVGGPADLDQAAVEQFAHARRVAGGKAEGHLRRGTSPSEDSMEIIRRMPSGCTPEPAGRVGAEDDALRARRSSLRGPQRQQCRRAHCRCARFPAPRRSSRRVHTICASGRAVWPPLTWPMMSVSASSTTSLSMQARAGNRRTAGVDGALDAVFARPGDHLPAGLAVLDRAEADLAEQLHAGRGEIAEILLDHAVLDHRRAGHAPSRRTGGRWRRFVAPRSPAPSGRRCRVGRPGVCTSPAEIIVVTPPCSSRIDPADLVLPRRPVAGDRMHMAVDQAGRDRASPWRR